MTSTILGIYGIERIDEAIDECLVTNTASLAVMQWSDSNYYNATGSAKGYSDGDEYALQFGLGKQVVATCPTIGIYINNGANRAAHLNQSNQSLLTADVSDPATAPSWLLPYMPVGAALQTVETWEPAYLDSTSHSVDTVKIIFNHTTDGYGINCNEKLRFYAAVVGNAAATSHPYRVRQEGAGTTLAAGTLTHSALSGLNLVLLGTANATAGTRNYNIEINPTGTNGVDSPTIVGPLGILSVFATLPDRARGYCLGPMLAEGGMSASDMAAGVALMDAMYLRWKIRCFDQALEGHRSWGLAIIDLGLNDRARSSPHNTAAGFASNITTIIQAHAAAFAAEQAAGTLTALIGMRYLIRVCGHRIYSDAENTELDFCHEGARTVVNARGDTATMDVRGMISTAEAQRIGDAVNGEHLTGLANYRRRAIENWTRLVTAARLSRRLRRAA